MFSDIIEILYSSSTKLERKLPTAGCIAKVWIFTVPGPNSSSSWPCFNTPQRSKGSGAVSGFVFFKVYVRKGIMEPRVYRRTVDIDIYIYIYLTFWHISQNGGCSKILQIIIFHIFSSIPHFEKYTHL